MATVHTIPFGYANRGGHHDWPFIMAEHLGLFARHGLALDIRLVPGGDALAAAIGRGEIPLGRMGTPPFLQAVANGRFAKGRIVASGVHGSLDHFFMAVSPDIEHPAQLKGRTVGVLSLGSCDGHLLRLMLARAGLDPERDVRYEERWGDYERLDALADGRLAAQLSAEPMLSLAEARGWLRVLDPVSVAEPHFQWGLIVGNADFIAAQPRQVEALRAALREGAQACVDDPATLKTLLRVRMPEYDDALLDRVFARVLPKWNVPGTVDLAGLDAAVRTMQALNMAPAGFDARALLAPGTPAA